MDDLGGMGGGFGDVLGNLFGGGARRGGRSRGTGPQRGGDLEAGLHLDFTDAVTGVFQGSIDAPETLADWPGDYAIELTWSGTGSPSGSAARPRRGNPVLPNICPACG